MTARDEELEVEQLLANLAAFVAKWRERPTRTHRKRVIEAAAELCRAADARTINTEHQRDQMQELLADAVYRNPADEDAKAEWERVRSAYMRRL